MRSDGFIIIMLKEGRYDREKREKLFPNVHPSCGRLKSL